MLFVRFPRCVRQPRPSARVWLWNPASEIRGVAVRRLLSRNRTALVGLRGTVGDGGEASPVLVCCRVGFDDEAVRGGVGDPDALSWMEAASTAAYRPQLPADDGLAAESVGVQDDGVAVGE